MKILAPLLRYDYGNPKRGDSLEKIYFVPALSSYAEVHVFWLEEHGFPNDLEGLQRSLIEEAERVDPNLIFFILMKDEIREETIATLSRRWVTANWFCDDQWRFDSFTSSIAPLLHYPITVDKFSIPKYKAIGCNNVILSQWASPYLPIDKFPGKYEYDVSFIGGRNSVREWYIYELKKAGIQVACFGSGWDNGRVPYEQMKLITQRSKISLNLSNSQQQSIEYRRYLHKSLFSAIASFDGNMNRYMRALYRSLSNISSNYNSQKRIEQIKARIFEIPAWGGFQLSQFALGIEDYFVPGKEIVYFSNPGECIRLVSYYLENNEEREVIRINGHKRAATHTYENRMRDILERIAHDQGLYCRS